MPDCDVFLRADGTVRFVARRPDGVELEAVVTPAVVHAKDDWRFQLEIENGPPRGGHLKWIVSHVLGVAGGA